MQREPRLDRSREAAIRHMMQQGSVTSNADVVDENDLGSCCAFACLKVAMSPFYEPILGVPTTAHIHGGCAMGALAERAMSRIPAAG